MTAKVEIIAHRGYRERFPENTLAAFDAAVAAGAHGVELDVQFCRDGTPVVFHDADMARVTGGPADEIFDLDLAQLRGLSAHEPERFGDRFLGTPIPTLAETVAHLRDSLVKVFVEIKRDSVPHHQIPEAVEAVARICQPLGERLVIISFDEGVVQQARSHHKAAIGWVLPHWGQQEQERAGVIEPEYLFCSLRKLPPASVPLWPGPWRWAIYEINDAATARALVDRGVHGLETAAVQTLVEALS